SRLQLRSARHIPGFFRSALKIRRQVRRSPGAIGVSLLAQPLRKTFWTLSAWIDQAALDMFVRTEPHAGIMARYHDRLVGPEFTTWTMSDPTMPKAWSNAKERWADGKGRLAAQRSP
ncbi:MAG: DUF3291 domain-containing protein, partial [Jiangellaceae bacterium]